MGKVKTLAATASMFAAFSCAAKRNQAGTELTLGAGAGRYAYEQRSGCVTTRHAAEEVVVYGGFEHHFDGFVVADGAVTVAPSRSGTRNFVSGAVTGRAGGDWPALGLRGGLQLHSRGEHTTIWPSGDLRLGPRALHAWGALAPPLAPMVEGGHAQAGVGSTGRLGHARLGATAAGGLVGRGELAIAPRWRLGVDLTANTVRGSALDPGAWRAVGLVTFRVPQAWLATSRDEVALPATAPPIVGWRRSDEPSDAR